MKKLPLDVLKDEKAPVIALLAVVIAAYGKACYDWNSALLKDEISRDYSIDLSDLQSDKIQTGLIILDTIYYEGQYEVFETCNHLLNNQADCFLDVSPLEAEELIAGYAHYRLIVESLAEVRNFDDEVNAYAGKIFYEYGFCEAPLIFPTAIMPENINKCDMTEKNAALQELFEAKTKQLKEYMANLSGS